MFSLLDLLESATDAFDQGKQFAVAYLDFSKAFDEDVVLDFSFPVLVPENTIWPEKSRLGITKPGVT